MKIILLCLKLFPYPPRDFLIQYGILTISWDLITIILLHKWARIPDTGCVLTTRCRFVPLHNAKFSVLLLRSKCLHDVSLPQRKYSWFCMFWNAYEARECKCFRYREWQNFLRMVEHDSAIIIKKLGPTGEHHCEKSRGKSNSRLFYSANFLKRDFTPSNGY